VAPGRYRIPAPINTVHTSARDVCDTGWSQVVTLVAGAELQARDPGYPTARVLAVLSEWCVQRNSYGGFVLDLSRLDLEEIATALADQTDYERRYLIDPQTGEIVFWTSVTGIDGQTPVDLDELDRRYP
jgi:hypothetical protein